MASRCSPTLPSIILSTCMCTCMPTMTDGLQNALVRSSSLVPCCPCSKSAKCIHACPCKQQGTRCVSSLPLSHEQCINFQKESTTYMYAEVEKSVLLTDFITSASSLDPSREQQLNHQETQGPDEHCNDSIGVDDVFLREKLE